MIVIVRIKREAHEYTMGRCGRWSRGCIGGTCNYASGCSGLKFVSKNVIKGGLVAYSGTITFFHQTTKSFEDLSSEARSELANSKKQEPEKKSNSRTTQQKAKTSTSEK
jgi:hypothetical protein